MKDLMHIFTAVCLAGAILSLLLFAVAWMCEQRFNLYRKVQAIFHRSFVETFLLLLFCIGLIHVGSTKNAVGSSNDAERSLMTDIVGVQVPVIESVALLVDMPMMITNLSIFAITPAETSVFLSAIWPEGCVIPNSKLSVYALHDLATNDWAKVAVASLPSDAMMAEMELPHAILPEGCDSKTFFTVGTFDDSDGDGIADSDERLLLKTNPYSDDSDGDSYPDGEELHSGTEPNMVDTDGDGLSDGDEVGSISVMPYFEWYKKPVMSSVQSISPLIESYFGASAILQLSYPAVIRGRKCVQLVAFDNGYVALSSPGDFNGWSFPYGPMHLNEHCYNSGSIFIAPYWSSQQVTGLITNSWLKAWNDESRNVAVVEFNNVLCDVNKYMTFQVVIPYGTGNVVKVSFKSSDIPLDGTYAVSGFHHKGYEATNGIYNVEWDFARRGVIPVGKTLEYRFGVGTDPLSWDSDGDMVRDDEEFAIGTKPLNPDSDGDGLTDGDEVDIFTNPLVSDTDGDGLSDKWESDYGLDPKSSGGVNGGSGDYDEDGLSNLEEYVLGTNPNASDEDDDGLNDSQEIINGTSPSMADTDRDGLSDGYEVTASLNPLQPDTDGDGMHDGWESRQDGFDPAVNNDEDEEPDNNPDADPDGDGVNNWLEFVYGSNPLNAFSFDNNVSDLVYARNGFSVSPPDNSVEVTVSVGDSSGSHSERWGIILNEKDGDGRRYVIACKAYGEVSQSTIKLEQGKHYVGNVVHYGTLEELESSDYDWTLQIDSLPSSRVLPSGDVFENESRWIVLNEKNVMIDNKDGLAGISDDSFHSINNAEGKRIHIYVIGQEVLDDGTVMQNNSYALVSQLPEMPRLTQRLIPMDIPDSYDCRMHIEYNRNSIGQNSFYPGPTADTWHRTSAMEGWNIYDEFGSDFRGGLATVISSYKGLSFTNIVHIRGSNPVENLVGDVIGSNPWYIKGIAKQESGMQNNRYYCQFNEIGPLGYDWDSYKYCPNFGRPNGWGIFQLDPPPNEETLWNWRTNIQQGKNHISECILDATEWINSQIRQQASEEPHKPLSSVVFVIGGQEFRMGTPRTPIDACAIQRYNGASRWVIYWRNKTSETPGAWCVEDSSVGYISNVLEKLN